MADHSMLCLENAHALHFRAYADETARLADTVFTANDVYKVAIQGTGVSATLWMLVDHDPVTWVQKDSSTTPPVPYVELRHVETDGTEGGGAVANAWTKLTVNEETIDSAGICSLADSQITLPAGTYDIEILQCFWGTNATSIRLRDVDSNVTLKVGSVGVPAADGGDVKIHGRVVLAIETTMEIQYIAQTAVATYGLGLSIGSRASNYDNEEIYLVAIFQKVE